jgi:hypothetical protein
MVVTVEEKCAINGETPGRKKSRRRPRHRKKKPVESAAQASPSDEAASETDRGTSSETDTPALQGEKPHKFSFTIEPAKPAETLFSAKQEELDALFFLPEEL